MGYNIWICSWIGNKFYSEENVHVSWAVFSLGDQRFTQKKTSFIV